MGMYTRKMKAQTKRFILLEPENWATGDIVPKGYRSINSLQLEHIINSNLGTILVAGQSVGSMF